jgi:3-deoxy-D-manno-octulosonic-acid transferase
VIERFHLAFRAGLINRFGEIPTASKLAIEFNLRNFQSKPISRESARKWINGQSIPETARLKTLIGWLNLDAAFIYSTTITETASIPVAIDRQKDRAKVEAYGRRKIEGLAQAALNFVSPLTAVLNTEGGHYFG